MTISSKLLVPLWFLSALAQVYGLTLYTGIDILACDGPDLGTLLTRYPIKVLLHYSRTESLLALPPSLQVDHSTRQQHIWPQTRLNSGRPWHFLTQRRFMSKA
jgi:hypothetical protein